MIILLFCSNNQLLDVFAVGIGNFEWNIAENFFKSFIFAQVYLFFVQNLHDCFFERLYITWHNPVDGLGFVAFFFCYCFHCSSASAVVAGFSMKSPGWSSSRGNPWGTTFNMSVACFLKGKFWTSWLFVPLLWGSLGKRLLLLWERTLSAKRLLFVFRLSAFFSSNVWQAEWEREESDTLKFRH